MASFVDELVEGKIDFVGQFAVDNLSRGGLVIACLLSFLIGFVLQDLRATFVSLGVSVLALAAVVLPPWPMFNRHPVKWLPAKKE